MSPPLALAMPEATPDRRRVTDRPQREGLILAAALLTVALALMPAPDDTPAPAEPPDTRPSLPGRLTGA
jgi:hypothetical protein